MRLNTKEIFTLFVSVFFLSGAEIEIRLFSSDKIIKKLQSSKKSAKPAFYLSPLQKLKRTRLISLLEAADRNLGWKASCLRRTVALAGICRKLGLSPEFKIGVLRRENEFRAHSWLEIDGLQLEMDDEAAGYEVLSEAKKQ